MTHSLSVTAAESPPAMYRRATLAMVVSSTSMNVGTRTATAISQGPKRRRGSGVGTRVSGVIKGSVLALPLNRRRLLVCATCRGRIAARFGGRCLRLLIRRSHRRLGQRHLRLQHLAGVGSGWLLAIIDVW